MNDDLSGETLNELSNGKGEIMEKIILKNELEIEIKEGASLEAITVIVRDFAALQPIGIALKEKKNLDLVLFVSNDKVIGEYADMVIVSPLFREVDIDKDGKIQATFSIRQKTEIELIIEELQKKQSIQDGAIVDLGDAVSNIVEGGEV